MDIPADVFPSAAVPSRSSKSKEREDEDEDDASAESDDYPGRPIGGIGGTPTRPWSGARPAPGGARPASAPRAQSSSYTQYVVRETRSSMERGPNDDTASSSASSSSEDDDELHCKRCDRAFAPGMRARHVCKGVNLSKNLRIRAIKEMISQTKDKPDVFANGKAITRASITSRAPDAPLDPMIKPGFGQGWAIRRSDPYVGISMEWRELAKSTFDSLEVNGHKTSAEDLHEALTQRFKDQRCDIPGLEEIRSLNQGFSKDSIEAKKALATPKVEKAKSQPGPSNEAPPVAPQTEGVQRGLAPELAKKVEDLVREGRRDPKGIAESLGVTDEATKTQIKYKVNNFSQLLKNDKDKKD
jgi:hypothetical protein